MKKKILIIGAKRLELTSLSSAIDKNHEITLITTSLMDAQKQSIHDLKDLANAFSDLAIASKETTKTIEIHNERLPKWELDPPKMDPSLPMPTSFQDPKGKKTGTIWHSGMTETKRHQLRAKRKKKKKR